MIVFAAGMRRAGSTVIFNIARELVEVSKSGYALTLPAHEYRRIKSYFNESEPVVVKGHRMHENFVGRMHSAKVLMSVRDLREIASDWSIERSRERAEKTAGTNHITFLNPGHITSGKSHTMENYLTKEQIQIITDKYGWWLEAYGYPT